MTSPVNGIPDIELSSRIDRVKRKMSARHLDALLISFRGAESDFFYFTGYTPMGDAVLVVPLTSQPVLFFGPAWDKARTEDSVYVQDLRLSSAGDSIREAATFANGLSGKTIGIDRINKIPVEVFELLKSTLNAKDMVDAFPMIRELRLIHSDWEIECYRRAVAIAETGMVRAAETLRRVRSASLSEYELAREIQLAMAADELHGFHGVCVSSGKRSAQPVSFATEKVIQPDELVVIDIGGSYRSYRSDICRTFVVGDARAEVARMISAVREVSKLLIEGTTVGDWTSSVQETTFRLFEERGYGASFLHHIAHDLGYKTQELLNFKRDNLALKAGMVFALEPAIYEPDIGGVRIEDDMWMTESGAIRLTHLPDVLEV